MGLGFIGSVSLVDRHGRGRLVERRKGIERLRRGGGVVALFFPPRPPCLSPSFGGEEEEESGVEKRVPMLSLRDVWVREPNTGWGYYLFEGLNFDVWKNEVVLVLGENGAGKSTMLDLIGGHGGIHRGKIMWNGMKTRQKTLHQNVGMVFQFPSNYFLGRNVLEELVLGRDWVTPDLVREVMYDVGLEDVSLLLSPKQLSGGQKRRLALASQLVRRPLPSLLLLDEPLAGVDRRGHRGIIELIQKFKAQVGFIIVTHEPGLLLGCADRIVQVAHKRVWPVSQEVLRRGLAIRRLRGENI